MEQVEPTALATIGQLTTAGWTSLILSGGFRQCIAPLATHLGITRIEAVDLFFDAAGNYTFEFNSPGMYRAARLSNQPSVVAIYGDEATR